MSGRMAACTMAAGRCDELAAQHSQPLHCDYTVRTILAACSCVSGCEELNDGCRVCMQLGQKDGVGEYLWPSGAVYRGEWREGFMHGDYPEQACGH